MSEKIEGKEKILKSYFPIPEIFQIWFDNEEDVYKTIIKFKKSDNEIFLANWDKDFNNIDEICINKEDLKKISEVI